MAEVLKAKQEGIRRTGESSGGNAVASALGGVGEYPKRIKSFFHDVRVEMNRVNWPSRADVWSTTVVVIVTVAFFAVFFFLTDSLLSKAEDWLFHVVKH